MGYKKYIRILEGNKQLARNIGAYIKRRDKLTRIEWEKNIKPLMKKAENDIRTKLKSNDLTSWKVANLQTILGQVQASIFTYTEAFKTRISIGEIGMAEVAADNLDFSLKSVGLQKPSSAIIGSELIANQIPMTKAFVDFFGKDMSKIIQAEISLSLVNKESVNQAARRIRNKFKASNMSYARAERIARTEMMTSASIARHKRAVEVQEFNPGARKVWIHNPSGEPRTGHMLAQSIYKTNPIRINADFEVQPYAPGTKAKKNPKEKAKFPRDYSLSAINRVNCKCTVAIINKADLSGLEPLGE